MNNKYKFHWILIFFLNSILVVAQQDQEYFDNDYSSRDSRRAEAEKLFDQGKKEYDKENFALATDFFNEVISIQPAHVQAYVLRAGSKENSGDLKGALTDYNIAIHLDPTISEAVFNRAALKYKLGEYKGAIEDFTLLLSMPAPNTQALYFRGNSYGEANAGASQIISMYSKDADIYNYLGLSKANLEDYHAAIEDFNKAIRMNEKDANFLVNRGLAYSKLNKETDAVSDFKKALEIEPSHSVAIFNLSMYSKGSEDDILIYDNMIKENDDFPSAYINRGLVKYKRGDFLGAIEDYNQAIQLDKSNPLAFLNRALAKEKLEKYNEAIKDLNQAVRLDPQLLKAYSSRGNIYFKLNEFEKAILDYNEVIRLSTTDAAIFFNRALAKYKLKMNNDACSDLEAALKNGYEAAQKALDAYCR